LSSGKYAPLPVAIKPVILPQPPAERLHAGGRDGLRVAVIAGDFCSPCPAAKTKKKPAGVSQGEHEHLLPSEPDKADTQGCDARAVVDHR